MENVALPAGLQTLIFGGLFNQSVENVALPPGLQTLTFGEKFDQSMENVALPADIWRGVLEFVGHVLWSFGESSGKS